MEEPLTVTDLIIGLFLAELLVGALLAASRSHRDVERSTPAAAPCFESRSYSGLLEVARVADFAACQKKWPATMPSTNGTSGRSCVAVHTISEIVSPSDSFSSAMNS